MVGCSVSDSKMPLNSHPYADLFPLLEGEDLERLAEDIREHGLHHPIVRFQGKILDGRNRLRACELAGVEPRFDEFNGTDDEALALVVSLNLTRRHLNTTQRAALAAELVPFEEQEAAKRRRTAPSKDKQNFACLGRATDVAGTRVGVSSETVRQAAKIKDKAPEVFSAMTNGTIRSMPEAILLAKLPEGQREDVLQLVTEQKIRVNKALLQYRKQTSADAQRIRKNAPTRVEHPAYKLIYGQHVMDSLKELPDQSVHVVCTSPPYWGLRDFGTSPVEFGGSPDCQHDWQPLQTNKDSAPLDARRLEGNATCSKCGAWSGHLGQEYSHELYVSHLVDIFREIRRVLRDDGTVWLNIGDCYSTTIARSRDQKGTTAPQIKQNDLMGMPWMVALALKDDGWYLRSDIVWHKENAQPESKLGRPTQAHEYVFLLSKAPSSYYYDQYSVLEPWADADKTKKTKSDNGKAALVGRFRRSVWKINTCPRSGGHQAVWPPELVELMILAGTSDYGVCPSCGAPWTRVVERPAKPSTPDKDNLYSEEAVHRQGIKNSGVSSKELDKFWKANPPMMKGWTPGCDCKKNDASGRSVVLDPFSGSGTTGMVALQLGRNYIGLDLNSDYLELAEKRVGGWHKGNR